MKAIVKEKTGIFLRDIPVPKPRGHEVLIKVAIAGYCRTDGYVAKGKIKTKVPLILGHEFSGIVEHAGSKVKIFKKGDRVAVMPILPDNDGYYSGPMHGVDRDGAFAEYVAIPEVAVYKIPAKLSFKEAAYLEPVAASLAVLNAPIKKEQTGFIIGTNRIAKLTLKVLALHGFNSIKMIAPEKLNRVPENSYDFVIETGLSTHILSRIIEIIRPGGLIILKSRQYTPIQISVGRIVKKDLRFFGTYYGSFKEAINLLVSGKLKVNDIFGSVVDLAVAVEILKGSLNDYEEKKIFFDPSL